MNREIDWVALRKIRENSKWNRLLPVDREELDKWLFDENLGYKKIVELVKSKFDVSVSVDSVGRYYRRRARERQAEELAEAKITADQLNDVPLDSNSLRTATMKLIGKAALNLGCEKPEEIEQMASLAELLLEAERNDLRRERIKLAQRCFDFEAVLATVKEMPQVRAYLQAITEDTSLSDDERTQKIQEMFFHWIQAAKEERAQMAKKRKQKSALICG